MDKNGSRDPSTIFTAIGVLTTAWENLEISFFTAFCKITEIDIKLTYEIYSAASAFRSRVELLKRAVRLCSKINDADKSRFIDLIRSARKYAEIRNQVAHGCLVERNRVKGDTKEADYVLGKPIYAWRIDGRGDEYAYNAKEILEAAEEIKKCSDAVMSLLFSSGLFPHPPEMEN